MMFEVRITQAAWSDAEAIYDWICSQGAQTSAERWFNGLLTKLRALATFPEGRTEAPESSAFPNLELHQQLYGQFRSLFVVRDKTVYVVHVRRASRRTATPDTLEGGIQEVFE